MGRGITEAVAKWEAALREWAALDRRFDDRTANPHSGTTRANRLAKRLYTLDRKLNGEPSFRRLVDSLLTDPDLRVRCHAAMDALAWDPVRAEQVLVGLEAGPGLVAISAHYVLLRHRAQTSPASDQASRQLPEAPISQVNPEMEGLSDDVWAFHGATMNGGFLLAFASVGHLADRVTQAFQAIGLPEVAALIASGSALFPGGDIPEAHEERVHLVDHVIDANKLEALGDGYQDLISSDRLLAERLEQLAQR